MPQGSYEVSREEAVRNALRFIKEAGCDAIKLEGGARMFDRVKAIVDAGILVIGHLGLTPQSASSFGGYRVQGKSKSSFEALYNDSVSLCKAGTSAILLEAVPAEVAGCIAKKLATPIYGIGAGEFVDGQLVIMHDLMGFYQAFRPWFAKCYIPQVADKFNSYISGITNIREVGIKERKDGLLVLAQMAIEEYIKEVKCRSFPSAECNYPITEEQLNDVKTSNLWSE
jgi:3-methyl-2-oxobutanoate hydroxymethyltransferase